MNEPNLVVIKEDKGSLIRTLQNYVSGQCFPISLISGEFLGAVLL